MTEGNGKNNPARSNSYTCRLEGDLLSFCKSLGRLFDYGKHHTSNGIHHITIKDFETGEIVRDLVTVNAPAYKPNGVVLNFCPFCGEPLLSANLAKRMVEYKVRASLEERKKG